MLLGYGESAVVRLLVVQDGRRVLRALGGDRPGIVAGFPTPSGFCASALKPLCAGRLGVTA